MEDDQEYQLIQEVLTKLKLEKYLQDFKAEGVTDEVVQEDIVGENQCIKAVIPTVGHQFKFTKEFKAALGIERASSSPQPQQTSTSKVILTLETNEDPKDTKNPSFSERCSALRQEIKDAGQPKSFGRRVMTTIGDTLGFNVQSHKAVMRKVHDEIIKNWFNAFVDPELAEVDFLEVEEMEQLLTQAEGEALTFFKEVVRDLEDQLKEAETKTMDSHIERRKIQYRNINFTKKNDCMKEVAETASKVLKTHFSLWKTKEEFGGGKLQLEELECVRDTWADEAELEFQEACGHSPFYDAVGFSKDVELSWDRLLEEVTEWNLQVEKRAAEVKSRIICDYRQSMMNGVKLGDFTSKHEKVVESIKKTISESQLDFESKKECLEFFEDELETLMASVHQDIVAKIAELEKIPKKAFQGYVEATDLVLAKEAPVYGPTLVARHQQCKREALRAVETNLNSLEKTTGPLGESTKASIIRSLEEEINDKFQENETINLDRWAQLETEIDEFAETLVTTYTEQLGEVTEKAVDRSSFERSEKLLQKASLKAFKEHMRTKKLDFDFTEKKEEEFISILEKEKSDCSAALDLRLEDDKDSVKFALFEVRRYYKDEMDKKFTDKSWYEPNELDRIQSEVLNRAIELAKEKDQVELTEPQEIQLRSAIQTLLQKYKEQNERQNPEKQKTMAIGIDLGTTYSCVGVFHQNKVKIIGDFQSAQNTTVASYVAFNEDGTIDVGHVAAENAHRNPRNTVFDAKRLIGKKFNDADVRKDCQSWPFDVVDVEGEPRIRVLEKNFRPEEIAAKVLVKMKTIAQDYLNRPVTKAVVTVPAYFGDAQRKATKDAAYIAGLDATIMNEPTAAAICYGLHRTGDTERNVLVFDLGGGTFDVVVLTMHPGQQEFTVKAIGGNTHIGGRDFDNNMMEALVKRVKGNHQIDLARDRDSSNKEDRLKALSRLRRLQSVCEVKKRILSDTTKTTILIDKLDGDYDMNEVFTQEEFNKINEPLFEKCIKIVENTIAEACLKKKEVDDIVLVGGSTRIPKVQQMLTDFFDGKTLSKTINADEAVAYGAAFQAALLHGEEQVPVEKQYLRYKDVTPFPLGIGVYTAAEPDQRIMNVLIPKNSQIPFTNVQRGYGTAADFQTTCEIFIYEGSQQYAKDNTLLGQFKLTGIPCAKAGEEEMECSMTIDQECVLHVEARVITSGKREKLKIETYNGRMSAEEKEKARKEDHSRWK